MKSLRESLLDDEDVLVDRTSLTPLIEKWLKSQNILHYKINDDYTIDVSSHCAVKYTELPDYIQFNEVNGNFNLLNVTMKNLKGCPKKIKGAFYIYNAKNLTSLEGAPLEIKDIDISNCYELNDLTGLENSTCENLSVCDSLIISMKGCPKVLNDIELDNILIEDLMGLPKKIKGRLSLNHLPRLIDLQGVPEHIGGYMMIYDVPQLKTLKYAPKTINGDLIIQSAPKLKQYSIKSKIKGEIRHEEF